MSQIAIGGYLVQAQKYTVSKQAKLVVYSIPNSQLDSLVPMGGYNRVHEISLTSVNNADIENVLLILSTNLQTTLLDIEGNSHTVMVKSVRTKNTGGQVGIFTADITFVEVAA